MNTSSYLKRGKPSSENNASEHGVARAVQHFKTENLKASSVSECMKMS